MTREGWLCTLSDYLALWPECACKQRAHPPDEGQAKARPAPVRALALRGGFPTPAVQLTTAADRRIWFDGYVRTYLERDLQDLATISALPDFPRLIRATCLRMGQLVNQTELGRDVSLPQPIVHRWLNLLETSYLLVRLPAYAVNRAKRLIKAPKIYWGDTGIALHLAEIAEPPARIWRMWSCRTFSPGVTPE